MMLNVKIATQDAFHFINGQLYYYVCRKDRWLKRIFSTTNKMSGLLADQS